MVGEEIDLLPGRVPEDGIREESSEVPAFGFFRVIFLGWPAQGVVNIIARLPSVVLTSTRRVVCALISLINSHSNGFNTEGMCCFVMEGDSDGVSHLCRNDGT